MSSIEAEREARIEYRAQLWSEALSASMPPLMGPGCRIHYRLYPGSWQAVQDILTRAAARRASFAND